MPYRPGNQSYLGWETKVLLKLQPVIKFKEPQTAILTSLELINVLVGKFVFNKMLCIAVVHLVLRVVESSL